MGHGMDSWASFTEESVWGTPPGGVADIYAYMLSDSMKIDPSHKFYPGMRTGPGRAAKFLGYERCSGGLQLEGYFEGALPLLLKHAMGSVGSAGADPYTHTFALDRDLPVGLGVEIAKADVEADEVFRYDGCLVNSLSLTFAPESMAVVDVGLIAKTRTTGVARSGAPSFPGDYPILFSDFTSLQVAGISSIAAKQFSLTINNNLDADRFFMSRALSRPERKTWREVTGSFVVEFDSLDWADALKAGTEGTFALIFTSGTRSITIQSSGGPTTFVTEGEPQVNGEGMLEQTVNFTCLSSDGTNEVAVTMITSEATIP